MDTVSAAPASASASMDHDEDVHRASEEGIAYTDANEDNSVDHEMDAHDRQYESDMEEFVDTDSDTDGDDFIRQLEEEVNRMNELDDELIYRIDQQIEDTELRERFEDERDRLRQIESDEMDLIEQRMMMRDQFESDVADFSDTDTDEEDSTGQLDDDMFRALSQMASSLCRSCRSLGRGTWKVSETGYTGDYIIHHLFIDTLQQSVDEGCRLCIAVAQSLEDFCQRSDPPVAKKRFWTIKGTMRRMDSALSVSFFLCQCESDHGTFDICEDASLIHNATFYPARKLGLGPEFLDPTLRTSSAKSATSFAVARSWYQQCLNHATCRNWRQESRVLPTRLIQIWRPENQSTDLSAKICETKDLPISTPYVTLSHCWGECVIFRLLKDNLQELSQAIPIGQLPKVFQDAIHVSHELGISYIWIDSLCIIQDSNEDWTFEAKRMGGVYVNGEFNIAATGYKDGLLGLFGERKAFSHVHIPMHMECELITEKSKSEAVFEGLYVAASHGEFSRHVVYSPLNSRGWVAQERALSPAIIHYTPEKIYWECNECIASEAFLDGSHIWEQTEGAGRDRIRSLSFQSEREDIYSFWRTFLNRYAGMDMTYEKDRLPALAGIARILSELINDNFVAGFWEGDLLRSLLLERQILVHKAIKREQLVPSWSWASMNADNSLPYKEVSQLEPLKGVHFRVLSDIPGFKSDLESPTFENSGVRGLAIKGVLRKLPDDFDAHKEWVGTTYFTYDNKDLAKLARDKVPHEQAWRLGDPTHMLLLTKRYDTIGSCICVQGLLVQVTGPKESNTFRRSGTFELAFHMDQECDEYLGLREKDGGYEASSYFTETGLQDLVLI